MDSLRQFPLGAPYPASPHAVVSCLPTLADVRGYEEKDPKVLGALRSGYPRFVEHAFIRELIGLYLRKTGLEREDAVLIPGRRATEDLISSIGCGVISSRVEDDLYLVYWDACRADLGQRVRKFLQHTGCGLSSRQAEDLLIAHGLRKFRFEEATCSGNALNRVEHGLAEQIGCRQADVLVCASGMNAFYSGFRAVQAFQRKRRRTAWIQLGWLYLDSGCVLQEFLDGGETLECIYDVRDVDVLVKRIQEIGDALAAVVVECPSNPLIRVCDLRRIAVAVREQGGVMVVDPTIASIYNIDVLPFADLLVTSLTKYVAIEGDIMIGALAVNPESPYYGDLILRTSAFYAPPYGRDLARLAREMEDAPGVVEKINTNAARLGSFLQKHPAVKQVYPANSPEHFEEVSRGGRRIGAVITIELLGNMESFYDAAPVMKGPSFGTRFTLLCPFMYLAHYDLVTTADGRARLASAGIDPELIRISVGSEDYLSIETAINQALVQSIQ